MSEIRQAVTSEEPVFAPLLKQERSRFGRFVIPSVVAHGTLLLTIFALGFFPDKLEVKDNLLAMIQPPPIRLDKPSMVYGGEGGGPGKVKKAGGGGGGGGTEGKMKVPTSPKPEFPNPKPAFAPSKIEDIQVADTSKAVTAIMNPKLAMLLPRQYSTMDNLGVVKGPNTDLGGMGGGVGGGKGTGVGSGQGSGIGTGSGGGWGTGSGGGWGSGVGPGGGDEIFSPGAGITSPMVIFQPDPKYTDEAVRARISGMLYLSGVVRKNGSVDSLKVIRGLGYGLDDEALKVVQTKWKFRPASKSGRPVDCYVTIEVEFRLY